jgi:acyl dehydratase
MTINPDRLFSWPFEDVVQTYTSRDSMFYALSIGLGADPMDEAQLAYVYEKSLRAFPTMALVLGHPGSWVANPDTGIDFTKLVFGEEILTLHRPLPPAATIRAREQVTGIVDKGEGRGALLYCRRTIVDDASNEPLATIDHTFFCRADGGFGGASGPVREPAPVPTAPAAMVVDITTLPQAALLYRLNADYNPLHCDPEVAKAAGFSRPILHGLCTYGVAAHAVVRACCGYDATRLKFFQARFTAPVFPGETISVEMWPNGDEISFRAWVRARETKVLDNGRALIG